MLSLIRHGKHERRDTHQEPVPPGRYWDLLRHDRKVARGEWVNPACEDMYAALRREYRRWQVQQRLG